MAGPKSHANKNVWGLGRVWGRPLHTCEICGIAHEPDEQEAHGQGIGVFGLVVGDKLGKLRGIMSEEKKHQRRAVHATAYQQAYPRDHGNAAKGPGQGLAYLGRRREARVHGSDKRSHGWCGGETRFFAMRLGLYTMISIKYSIMRRIDRRGKEKTDQGKDAKSGMRRLDWIGIMVSRVLRLMTQNPVPYRKTLASRRQVRFGRFLERA